MRKIILCMTVILFSLTIKAQNDSHLKNIEEVKVLSVATTKLFSEKKYSEAFEGLRPFWPLPNNEINTALEGTVKYSNILEERFGSIIGYEKVKEETIKDIAYRETYFVNYEMNAIRLIFTYYKGKKGWILNSFKWDDSFTEEFK